MELTPGELEGYRACQDAAALERDEAEWMRLAWQTSLITPMVWSNKSHRPSELAPWLPWADDVSQETVMDPAANMRAWLAYWRRLGGDMTQLAPWARGEMEH